MTEYLNQNWFLGITAILSAAVPFAVKYLYKLKFFTKNTEWSKWIKTITPYVITGILFIIVLLISKEYKEWTTITAWIKNLMANFGVMTTIYLLVVNRMKKNTN